MKDEIDINQIIEDGELKPYFLDFVAKSFSKNLYQSHHDRFQAKIKAQRDFYESLYSLSEKLKYVVPDKYIQSTITEVSRHYMRSLGSASQGEYA